MADHYSIPFRNDSGETIPAFAVMRPKIHADGGTQIIDREGRWCVSVIKPDTKFSRLHLINGPTAVPSNGYGLAADGSYPVLAREANRRMRRRLGRSAEFLEAQTLLSGRLYDSCGERSIAERDYRALFWGKTECNMLIVQGVGTHRQLHANRKHLPWQPCDHGDDDSNRNSRHAVSKRRSLPGRHTLRRLVA